MFLRAALFGSAVAITVLACTDKEDLKDSQGEATSCVKIEGADIGRRITVDVPSGDGTLAVTFISWIPKSDSPNEFVGFSINASADFMVKAGDETFSGTNSSWSNPFGAIGSLAKGISYVELCAATPLVTPPDHEGGGHDGGVDGGTDGGTDGGVDGGPDGEPGCDIDGGCDGSGSGGSGSGSGGEGSGSGSGSGGCNADDHDGHTH
jgi:hypothetical protein